MVMLMMKCGFNWPCSIMDQVMDICVGSVQLYTLIPELHSSFLIIYTFNLHKVTVWNNICKEQLTLWHHAAWKPMISCHHRHNLDQAPGARGQVPLQYFFYIRVVFFFSYWFEVGQIKKQNLGEKQGKGCVCILRTGSNQSSASF